MKNALVFACLAMVAATSMALHFRVGPIKVSSKSADKIIKEAGEAGDKVVGIAKGTGKWANTELITTLKGERTLRIKPYIALTHDGQSILVGPSEAHIKVMGLSLSTHHLAQRLAEIGCIVGTEGAGAVICATEAAQSLLQEKVGDLGIPVDAVGGTAPAPLLADNPNSNFCKAEPDFNSCYLTSKRPVKSLCGCFSDEGNIVVGEVSPNAIKKGDMTEVQLVPLKPDNPGFKF